MKSSLAKHAPDKTLAALAQEATCLQALVRAGYALDEAVRWLDAWAGPQPSRLWLSAWQSAAHEHDTLSRRQGRAIL